MEFALADLSLNSRMRRVYFFIALQLIMLSSRAQDSDAYAAGYYVRGNDTLPYRYLEPLHFKKGMKYPVIIVLHGSGERGKDNKLQLQHGGNLFVNRPMREKYPAYIIFPQCNLSKSWARVHKDRFPLDSLGGLHFLSEQPPTLPLSLLMQLLDSISNHRSVDKERIYIGGLSMGGMGTFELLWRKPGFFAAGFPICGGGDPGKMRLYKEVPLWIFHGEKDPVVRVANSRRMFNAFKAAGGSARYSEYPGVVHNSWDNAFAEPGLMAWLFSKSRKKL
jgi:predicted peptidase